MKIIATNKSASFEYFIEEKYEAGIVLEGNEIKSLRAGNVNMNDSFCFVRGSDVSVKNMHIALYDKSDAFSTKDTRRDRKLLLHNGEIAKIAGKINRQGYTLVPLKLYFKGSLVKMEIALCKGKHTYDKKQSIAERDLKRSADREIKNAGFEKLIFQKKATPKVRSTFGVALRILDNDKSSPSLKGSSIYGE